MSGDWLDAVAAENIANDVRRLSDAQLRADAHRIADHLAFRHTYEECVEMIYDALLRAKGGR